MKDDDVPGMGVGGPPSPTPLSLLEQLWNNDQGSWDRFAQIYLPFVYKQVRKNGVVVDDAEDVAHEVFLKVSKSIQGFRKQEATSSFRNWLATVSRTIAMDHHRKLSRQPLTLASTKFDNLSLGLDDADLDADVRWRIWKQIFKETEAKVGELKWRVFELFFLEKRPAKEVNQLTGVPENRVHSMVTQVRAIIRRIALKRYSDWLREDGAIGP